MLETTSTSTSTPSAPKANGTAKTPNSASQIMAELERLKAANADLQAKLAVANTPRKITAKVSEKGGLSVYGLGRFPVTLYKEQWIRLLAIADDIREFIKAHDHELKAKGE